MQCHLSSRAAALIVFLVSTVPVTAGAADEPAVLSAAQTLYDEGVAAMLKHDHASACPRLEEVVRLIPEGVGAKLTLAQCYEEAGHLASAWSMYARVAEAAAKTGQREREKSAEARVKALRPRLATLTIVPSSEARALSDLRVTQDGAPIGQAQWGLPVPLDRGEHVIMAVASGKRPWKRTIQIASDGVSATIAIEALEDEPLRASDRIMTTPPRAAEDAPSWRTAGFVSAGLGLAGIGAGALFGLRAMDKKRESESGPCDANGFCDETGLALRREGMAAGTLSTVFFVAGGVALAACVPMVLLSPRGDAKTGPRAEVSLGPGGISLRGAW